MHSLHPMNYLRETIKWKEQDAKLVWILPISMKKEKNKNIFLTAQK
jgi:hypothetical protein